MRTMAPNATAGSKRAKNQSFWWEAIQNLEMSPKWPSKYT